MRITLLNPPSEEDRYEHEHLSIPKIGLAYMAAYLEKNGIECSIVDAKFEKLTLEEVSQRLKKERPDLIGISAMTSEINSAARVADEFKKLFPDGTTLIGGAHAISIPKETLDEFKNFDILCTGEGEYTLLDLVQTMRAKKPLGGVKGIFYRNNGNILENPPRDWIVDLDELPFPAWNKYPKKSSFNYVVSTRGCPFSCAFCMTILGKKQRKRSIENVVDEIEWLLDNHDLKEMCFIDETFTLDLKRTHALLDLIIERGVNRRLKWIAQTRVDKVDEKIFIKLKKAGCYKIEFGVESGNQKILDYIKKEIKLEQVEKAVHFAKKAKLKVGCSFIIGHPGETKKTAQDTIDFIVKLNPDIASLGIMVPHPGTKVYELAQKGEAGYVLSTTNWSDCIKFGGSGLELENLSRKEMEKLQIKGYLSFYLKNFRFLDILFYALEHRNQAFAAAKKIISF